MKILKGAYKGVELAVPNDGPVRPTVDHFKKHILRLAEPLAPKIVWDLFAGSGGVGLEFLSLGANEVVFVEQTKTALNCLNLNIAECRLKEPISFEKQSTKVVNAAVENFLRNPNSFNISKTPDLVFMDPPYGEGYMSKTLSALSECSLLTDKTVFLAEHVIEDPLPELPTKGKILSQEIYGPKVLSLFKLN